MQQQVGDPTDFLETISTMGNHMPYSSAFSQDCSFSAVGCNDGTVFVYKLPLRYVFLVIGMPMKTRVDYLEFSPCSSYIFVFQHMEDNYSGFDKLLFYQVQITGQRQFFDMQVPKVGNPEIVDQMVIPNTSLIKAYFLQFGYRDLKLASIELLIHASGGVKIVAKDEGDVWRPFDLLEVFAPALVRNDLVSSIINVAVMLCKFYIFHIGNMLLIFSRDFRAASYFMCFTKLVKLSDAQFSRAVVPSIECSLLNVQSFVILDLCDDGPAYYTSYGALLTRCASEIRVPSSFVVMFNNVLHLLAVDVVQQDYSSESLSDALRRAGAISGPAGPYGALDISNISYSPPYNSPAYSNSRNILYQALSLNLFEISKFDAQALNKAQNIIKLDDYLIVITKRSIAIINVQDITRSYEVHYFQLECCYSSAAVVGSELYAIYAMEGNGRSLCGKKPLRMQRHLPFYPILKTELTFSPKTRDCPVLICLPVKFQEFGAFFNGFKPVGQQVLYIEREDEFDLSEDKQLYPEGSVQRSIEKIQQQVEGLKGWTEDSEKSIDFGHYE